VFIDGTYVKAHQRSAGAASDQSEAIGKSRAGHTSNIHLAVVAYGWPVDFEITGGDIEGCTAAPELVARPPSADVIVADKGYDSERIREQIETQGARPVTQKSATRSGAMPAWTGGCIATGILSRTPLPGSTTGPWRSRTTS